MFIKKITPKKKREILPDEYNYRPIEKIVCTFDTETDPFAPNRIVAPFTCGFHILPCDTYPTGDYWDFWGDDCIDQFFAWLDVNFPPEIELLIYTHNGGGFDFFFMVDHFDSDQEPFIINGRLVRVLMHGQEFRDSYSAIPVALGKYQKTEIDYNKMEKENRQANKTEILLYMRDDCIFLGQLVGAWLNDFGNKLTMASVALPKLMELHGIDLMDEETDAIFRPYYFGGRVQCFEVGLLEDDWKIYDVNSMYPSVMANYKHPVSAVPIPQTSINENTAFAFIRAYSDGALPVRDKHGGLCFPSGLGDYYACIHEINAGVELGILKIAKVYKAWRFEISTDFKEFVDTFFELRQQAKADKDTIHDIFYKLVMNSAYGKLAQDPRNYEDYLFDPDETPSPMVCSRCSDDTCPYCIEGITNSKGWYLHTIRNDRFIYARPRKQRGGQQQGFFNVATASSITSAARAELLRAINSADRPIYCDTDSLICTTLRNVRLHDSDLGSWKLEARGRFAAIGGKKLYAIYDDLENIKKTASKGVRLTAAEIIQVANGEIVEYANPVPKFHLDGSADFVTRRIQRTG